MNPILIQITDSFFIGWYGVMIAAGLLAAAWLASFRGKKAGYDGNFFYDLVFVAVISGFIGARLLYILTDLDRFSQDPGGMLFSRDGFVFLGGLLLATPACIIFIQKKGYNVLRIGDLIAPSLALGHAFGRVGCHLAGCCYGGVCEAPIGIRVPRVELPDGGLMYNAYSDHLEQGLISPDASASLMVWPVQLMESGGLLLLTGALLLIAHRVKGTGVVLASYLIGYSILRFLTESFRGDAGRGLYFDGAISTSQLLSVPILIVGAVLLAKRYGKVVPDPEPAPRPSKEKRASSSA